MGERRRFLLLSTPEGGICEKWDGGVLAKTLNPTHKNQEWIKWQIKAQAPTS